MADNNAVFSKHFVFLALLFVLGNACITTPVNTANQFNFLAFLIAATACVLVYFLASLLPFNKFTVALFWVLAIYCIGDAFITFISFISENLLPNSSRFLIAILFVLTLVYIAVKKRDLLFKFALLCGVFCLGVIVLFLAATLKDFNIKNIYIYELPNNATLFEQTVPYLKQLVLPVTVLAVFAKQSGIKKGGAVLSVAFGVLCFGVCILNSVLLFGIDFAARLDYPYSSAGSTVTFGYLFTRLDGLLYFVYLATCLVKCAVGIFVIKKSREILP